MPSLRLYSGDSRIAVPKQVPISRENFFHLNVEQLYHSVEWTSGNQTYILGKLKNLIIKRLKGQILTFVDLLLVFLSTLLPTN